MQTDYFSFENRNSLMIIYALSIFEKGPLIVEVLDSQSPNNIFRTKTISHSEGTSFNNDIKRNTFVATKALDAESKERKKIQVDGNQ